MMMAVPWDDSLNLTDTYTGWTSEYFSELYQSYFGEPPSYVSAGAFAGGEILMAAIEAAQSLADDRIVQELKRMHFPTIYGNITFDKNNMAIFDFLVVQVQQSLSYDMVIPFEAPNTTLQYPMPSWKKKDCRYTTDSCSGHGVCSDDGVCQCEDQYYGSANLLSCDTLCVGELETDPESGLAYCKSTKVMYIGVTANSDSPDEQELLAMLRLGVELVNNKVRGLVSTILGVGE
jgi:hypothetical protein